VDVQIRVLGQLACGDPPGKGRGAASECVVATFRRMIDLTPGHDLQMKSVLCLPVLVWRLVIRIAYSILSKTEILSITSCL
jgi:hypothetical protein